MQRIILLAFAISFLAATASTGAEKESAGTFVIEINTSKLYIYNAKGDEAGKPIKEKAVRPFPAKNVDGKGNDGLPVLDFNEAEGLVLVELEEGKPVWIETMAVTLYPSNRLDCPKVTEGRSDIEDSGMTIGFGDHCKDEEEIKDE